MSELKFQVTGVETANRGLTPLLHFQLRITAPGATDKIEALLLNAQIQILCPQRTYAIGEKAKLLELFGRPDQWGHTLRNGLWCHAHATVGQFTGSTDTVLPVPCTYDLNIASAKYLYALESGEVPLLFLFSGSVFYAAEESRLQVQPISWNTECVYRMPIEVWKKLMEHHYPNSAWVSLPRDVFDKLYAFKRVNGLADWKETIELLLERSDQPWPPTRSEGREPRVAQAEEVPL